MNAAYGGVAVALEDLVIHDMEEEEDFLSDPGDAIADDGTGDENDISISEDAILGPYRYLRSSQRQRGLSSFSPPPTPPLPPSRTQPTTLRCSSSPSAAAAAATAIQENGNSSSNGNSNSNKNGAVEQKQQQILKERALLVSSIKWLTQHLPETVVDFLIEEIEEENERGEFMFQSESGGILMDGLPDYQPDQQNNNQSQNPKQPAAYEENYGYLNGSPNRATLGTPNMVVFPEIAFPSPTGDRKVLDSNIGDAFDHSFYDSDPQFQTYHQTITDEEEYKRMHPTVFHLPSRTTKTDDDDDDAAALNSTNHSSTTTKGAKVNRTKSEESTHQRHDETLMTGETTRTTATATTTTSTTTSTSIDPTDQHEQQHHQQGGYYDEQGHWINAYHGYYDEKGNWTDQSGENHDDQQEQYYQGYYDEEGNWVDQSGENHHQQHHGYYDEHGNWIDRSGENHHPQQYHGYHDEEGNWVDKPHEQHYHHGYYDQEGNWVDQSQEHPHYHHGYYDEQGNWINSSQNEQHQHHDGHYDEHGNWVAPDQTYHLPELHDSCYDEHGNWVDQSHNMEEHGKQYHHQSAATPFHSKPKLGATVDDVSEFYSSGSDSDDLVERGDASGFLEDPPPKEEDRTPFVAIQPRKNRKFRSQSMKFNANNMSMAAAVAAAAKAVAEEEGEDSLGAGKEKKRERRRSLYGGQGFEESNSFDEEGNGMPPAYRHDCALLMVDISGFTKLSRNLKVEALSKTINAYFQMIVDEVEKHGGDILKFAGDAVFCEWRAISEDKKNDDDDSDSSNSSQSLNVAAHEPWHGLTKEQCVFTAAACGAKIVDKCSDYPVYKDGKMFSYLNVHCSVAYGEVAGVHVGDFETRMEYLILGEPIDQVAGAIDIAGHGEIVASPQALAFLKDTADLEDCVKLDSDEPQVIASRSNCHFRPKGQNTAIKDWKVELPSKANPRERLADRCNDLDFAGLKRLRTRMCHYIHPVVVHDELAIKSIDNGCAQDRHTSEAELRKVCTMFIMPKINCKLTGNDEKDMEIVILLNDIMLLVIDELNRYKGHLRQYIVDDKGVVLIANFGLRGSTFPAMVEERAIPFASNVHQMLKDELEVDNRIGATFNKVYCGVVGGVRRHEYAVLGPSVNLAARLMANKGNRGFLVDECCRDRTKHLTFRALSPVKAKGYDNLVPIFEPLNDPVPDQVWPERLEGDKERDLLKETVEGILGDEVAGIQMLVALLESARGRKTFAIKATQYIGCICAEKEISFLTIRACPVSATNNSNGSRHAQGIISSIFIAFMGAIKDISDVDFKERVVPKEESETKYKAYLMEVFEIIGVAETSREALAGIIFGKSTAAVGEALFDHLVSTFHYFAEYFNVVLLTLEDCFVLDGSSWALIESVFEQSPNSIILTTKPRAIPFIDTKISRKMLRKLKADAANKKKFLEFKVQDSLRQNLEADPSLVDTSAGDTFIQFSITDEMRARKKAKDCGGCAEASSVKTSAAIDAGNVSELILNRIDRLPTPVRKACFAGAILGSKFELLDMIIVFEHETGVEGEARVEHARVVKATMDTAVSRGILEIIEDADCTYHGSFKVKSHPFAHFNVKYRFTHNVWRSHILTSTLDSWKQEMHALIADAIEEAVEDGEHDDDVETLARWFSHVEESGNGRKTSEVAHRVGRKMEQLCLPQEAKVVYREAIKSWKSMDTGEDSEEKVGGLTLTLLGTLEAKDFDLLIKLHTALGRCFTSLLDGDSSKQSYQTALSFLQKMPKSLTLEDPDIIYPILSGLFVVRRFEHINRIEDEQGIVSVALKKARASKSVLHLSQALAMDAEMHARHGRFGEALEIVSELQTVYDAGDHTSALCEIYGSDYPSHCIAQKALWYVHLGDTEKAIKACRYVCKELLPRLDPVHVSSLFEAVYPIVWVMKDIGWSLDCRKLFDEYVLKKTKKLSEGAVTFGKPLHAPIMALLDMAGLTCTTKRLPEYSRWVLNERNGLFGSELNFLTGYSGRTADSITAEICLLLSYYTDDAETSQKLVEKGLKLANDVKDFACPREGSSGMVIAYPQLLPLIEELKDVGSYL